jgi:hypothetical protein
MGNDPGGLGKLLDEIANIYVELGTIYEIGSQPRFPRQSFENFQDRILTGKDTYGKEEY